MHTYIWWRSHEFIDTSNPFPHPLRVLSCPISYLYVPSPTLKMWTRQNTTFTHLLNLIIHTKQVANCFIHIITIKKAYYKAFQICLQFSHLPPLLVHKTWGIWWYTVFKATWIDIIFLSFFPFNVITVFIWNTTEFLCFSLLSALGFFSFCFYLINLIFNM